MGVDREHLESALEHGLGRDDGLVSFGTQIYPEPLSFPTDIPAYFYEVRADAEPFAVYRATFVRYEPDPGTEAFRRRLDETRPKTTLDRRAETVPEDEREPWWNGYLVFTDLEPLPERILLSRFRVGKRPFDGTVVRRPLIVELPDERH